MRISNASYNLNTNINTNKSNFSMCAPQNASFKAAQPKSKLFNFITVPFKKYEDKLTTKIAKLIVPLFRFKSVKQFVEATKSSKRLIPILSTITSTVLTGFYIQQTLKNKNLDSNKRNTLAINQALTALVATTCGWIVDDKTNKFIEKHFADKYSAVNVRNTQAKKLFHGINQAKSMIVFGLIYRYFGPVIVTPIANHIGNKLNEKKEAKEA